LIHSERRKTGAPFSGIARRLPRPCRFLEDCGKSCRSQQVSGEGKKWRHVIMLGKFLAAAGRRSA